MKGFIGFALLCASAASSAAEVADYRFESSYASSLAGAPPLVEMVPGGGTFENDARLGRTTWHFAAGTGLALDTTGLVPAGQYSVAMQIRISDINPYMKLLDTSGLQLDTGYYVLSKDIGFYDEDFGTVDGPLVPDVYFNIVLTRALDGTTVGYVDGDERFRFTDTDGQALIPADGLLYFVIDDEVTHGENSAGALARLRVFDTALTAAEVAALGGSTRIFRNGFED